MLQAGVCGCDDRPTDRRNDKQFSGRTELQPSGHRGRTGSDLEPELWASGRGPWAVGCGPWAVGRGPWAVGCGPWAMGLGPWAVG